MKVTLKDYYEEKEPVTAEIKPNQITVLVGRNGYGKSSFLKSLEEYTKQKKIPCLSWDDMNYGRENGKNRLTINGNMKQLAMMAFHSEGETIMSSFSYFFQRIRHTVQTTKKKQIFLLVDQIDSGLDIHQINLIKNVFRDTIIPDIEKHGITAFVVLTANSFEMVNNEDCLDPVTGKHHTFKTLAEYQTYIDKQYEEYKD